MKNPSGRIKRGIAPLFLGLGLLIAPALAPPARAQEEAAGASSEEKGRPLDGYLATATLAFLALFLVGKSARR